MTHQTLGGAAFPLPKTDASLPNLSNICPTKPVNAQDMSAFWNDAAAKVSEASMPPLREELFQLLIELAMAVAEEPKYAARAKRILAMSEAHRKKRPYTPGVCPPAPRCEACDDK